MFQHVIQYPHRERLNSFALLPGQRRSEGHVAAAELLALIERADGHQRGVGGELVLQLRVDQEGELSVVEEVEIPLSASMALRSVNRYLPICRFQTDDAR